MTMKGNNIESLEQKSQEQSIITRKELISYLVVSSTASFSPSTWAARADNAPYNFFCYWLLGTTVGVCAGILRNGLTQQYGIWDGDYKNERKNRSIR